MNAKIKKFFLTLATAIIVAFCTLLAACGEIGAVDVSTIKYDIVTLKRARLFYELRPLFKEKCKNAVIFDRKGGYSYETTIGLNESANNHYLSNVKVTMGDVDITG
jgi:hypothetical protein